MISFAFPAFFHDADIDYDAIGADTTPQRPFLDDAYHEL